MPWSFQYTKNQPPPATGPLDFDAEDFIRQAGKGVPLQASVDSVMNGGAVRVQFGPDLSYRIVPLLLCGVSCPRLNVRQGEQEGAPEPYARDAKYYTELKTLNRLGRGTRIPGIRVCGRVLGFIRFSVGTCL